MFGFGTKATTAGKTPQDPNTSGYSTPGGGGGGFLGGLFTKK